MTPARGQGIGSIYGAIFAVPGLASIPIGDLATAAAIMSVLSILLDVCHTSDHPLWVVARSMHDRLATITLSSPASWGVGPGPVAALAPLSDTARAINLEVL